MLTTTAALIVFLFPLAYSPGPGNLFFAANGARFGLRATVPASIGYHVATWIVTMAIGLGAFAVLEAAPQAFAVLRYAGALYVLWLAWKLFRAGALQGEARAEVAGFRDGAVLLLLNPKAYVIIALMFTQFLGGGFAGVALIATVFTLNNLVAFTLWTALGDALALRFRSDRGARKMNTGFAVVLAGVALWMGLG